MADAGASFAIATELLTDEPEALAWSNLGYWTQATDYPEACRQLALLLGAAAALSPATTVLDVACGQGASLALWPEAFGVRHITALELQTKCVESIRAQAPPALHAIHQARFDQLPLPEALPAHAFDAVLCVDAAYHAHSLADFASFAGQALKPGGWLVFTTLVQSPAVQTSWWRRGLVQLLLAMAQIPPASVLTSAELRRTLAQQGLACVAIRHLDANVLQGFADFVQRRGRELPWSKQFSAGWCKIRLTAYLCRFLHWTGYLHYSLIQGGRVSDGTS